MHEVRRKKSSIERNTSRKPVETQPHSKLIAEAFEAIKDADSVELKLTVPDTDQRSAIIALDMDVLDAEFRQVVFFDTPDLKLNRSGVVVRARRIRKGGDTVVKLRPVVPTNLPSALRHSGSLVVEVDAMPGAFICSGTLKGRVDNADVKQVLQDGYPIRKLFSREQRTLYKQHAQRGLNLDSLTPFGPINAAKLKFAPESFKRSLVAEVWFYPDASRILELSTKCAPGEAFQVLIEMRSFLEQRGISLTAKQETKTRKALEYFARLCADSHARRREFTGS